LLERGKLKRQYSRKRRLRQQPILLKEKKTKKCHRALGKNYRKDSTGRELENSKKRKPPPTTPNQPQRFRKPYSSSCSGAHVERKTLAYQYSRITGRKGNLCRIFLSLSKKMGKGKIDLFLEGVVRPEGEGGESRGF